MWGLDGFVEGGYFHGFEIYPTPKYWDVAKAIKCHSFKFDLILYPKHKR
jgi:hypothetical protein